MNIEEAIKILDKFTTEHKLFNIKHSDGLEEAIETLLTAYEKEKGENVKLRLQDIPLIEGELKAYKDKVNELKQELEKEKNKDMSCDLTETRADHIDESTMLKQIKLKLQEKNIPIETLLAEFERLEDLEDDLTTVYINGVYDGEKKVKDKIKAKIKELDKEEKEALKGTKGQDRYAIKQEYMHKRSGLQSLLEKEE